MEGKRALLGEKQPHSCGIHSEEISSLFSEHLGPHSFVFRHAVARRVKKHLPAHIDESLQLLLETTEHAVFWKDIKHRYLGCNSQFLKLIKHPNGKKVLGRTDRELCWQNVTNTQRIRRHECRCISKNETLRFCLERGCSGEQNSGVQWIVLAPLHSKEGRVVGLFGSVEDNSREEKMEKALRSCSGKFRSILEQLPGTLCLFDQDLNVTLCSGSTVFSVTTHKHPNKRISLYEVFHTDDPGSLPISNAKRALCGKSARFYMTKNGIRYQVQVEPLREGKAVTGGICLLVEV